MPACCPGQRCHRENSKENRNKDLCHTISDSEFVEDATRLDPRAFKALLLGGRISSSQGQKNIIWYHCYNFHMPFYCYGDLW